MGSNKALIAALVFFLLVCLALADPPTPHGIAGYIYESGGTTQVPLGTIYEINETVSKDYIKTQTLIPVPGMSGRYFATISGANNDPTIVRAWNSTHFGNVSVLLQESMDNVNVHLNRTRHPETNITMLFPLNNSIHNTSTYFNVTINVSVLGANGSACIATINFSNQSAFLLGADESATHQLGNINTTGYNGSIWNLTAVKYGSYNISVTAVCSNQTVILEHREMASVNVSVIDVTPPVVRSMYPGNNTLSRTSSIAFSYNVSETADLISCSLIINDLINLTNTTIIQKDLPQSLWASLNSGVYNWSINCTDQFGNIGASFTFNLSVNASGPLITGMAINSPIVLQSATTALVTCNATVTISDILRDISILNATLYDTSSAGTFSPDDNNNHYTNTSCEQTGKDGVDENYTCSFNIWYYANNATWECNMSAMDADNMTAISNISSVVNEIVSFGVNSSVLEYGSLNVTNTSGISNITMYNFGNKPLNVSVLGFAMAEQDGLAMVCEMNTNISIEFERYSVNPELSYEDMISLTSTSAMVANFTLYQRITDNGHDNDMNSTYWRISVPPPAASNCSGVITLAATKA
jgi:hypothetical protein